MLLYCTVGADLAMLEDSILFRLEFMWCTRLIALIKTEKYISHKYSR